MTVSEYFGWGLLVPAVFSICNGLTAHYAKGVLGYRQKNAVGEMIRCSFYLMLLFVTWGMVDYPLPLLYILAFFTKLLMLFPESRERTKKLFLINLTHLMAMALHMILIGLISLIAKEPMNELLQNPLWRIITVSVVLAAESLATALVLRWKLLLGVLRTQMDSAEVRPFMMFLWFCNMFLLLDSVLCTLIIEWNLLPVFLISSTLLMEFYLIRFLRHLFSVLSAQYLEEENRRLMEELELQNKTEEELRSKSDSDPLTGICSRRFVLEKLEVLMRMNRSFSLVYIDLDHLKWINDRYGHHAGDQYLKRFAAAFSASLRETDIFARIGGDEFLLLLPEFGEEEAAKLMEKIRTRLCEAFDPPLLFSFGTAFVPEETALTVEEVLNMADQAMYRDKRTRR
ncbi:GGDEF domain-containing protein [Clostridium sp. MCC353]|uniref:GGDEF domain-containing protein n=1 Tax=Clostridium sp. MCC353 TaxID=2592646 RepID=UPI001C02B134|nr:GGDEF domain-containing protein [Clostridium sp. MCC353]